jgi:hypothetical protein
MAFQWRSSLASVPPYFFRQVWNVAELIPWRRQISSTFAPFGKALKPVAGPCLTRSFSTPMILSSLNRLCFVALPPSYIQKWKIPVRNGQVLGGKVNRRGRRLHDQSGQRRFAHF